MANLSARIAAVVACVLVVAGCHHDPIVGRAVSSLSDPNMAGGLPVTDGPSGIRPNAPAATGNIRNTDHGAVDELALLSLNDIADFWSHEYKFDHGSFTPITNVASYDSDDPASPEMCETPTYGLVNAFYCPPDNKLMAWDRGVLFPTGRKYFGDISVTSVLAHEYGHAIQRMASLVNLFTPTIVLEQQADCFAGTYLRWVAQGESKRFTLSTGDGLNHVLAGLITLRDPIYTPQTEKNMLKRGHGNALDRVSAFQIGWISGADACGAIDYDNVKERRGDLPMSLQLDPADPDDTNPQPSHIGIDTNSISELAEFLKATFSPRREPQITYDSATPCQDAAPSPPASYCPSTNTIAINLPALKKMGTPGDEETKHVLIQGDNTAFSVVTSRYMLALEHERGLDLDTADAALRTACLTGVAQRRMAEPVKLSSGDSLVLGAGDLDEAIAGLLTNGLAASDVNGKPLPAGFTRIQMFRSGVLSNDETQCYNKNQFATP